MGWLALVVLLGHAACACADEVRLKDGRTLEGAIIRRQGDQILMAVAGRTEIIAAADVEAVRYDDLRLVPSPPAAPAAHAPAPAIELAKFNATLTEELGQRIKVFPETARSAGRAAQHAWHGATQPALEDVRWAAQRLLPVRGGGLDPYSALADLILLLGLRAPLLWLALALVRERRSYVRIAEYLALTYLAMMTLLAFSVSAGDPLVGLGLLGSSVVCAGALFLWMFGVSWPRSLAAVTLAAALMLGVDYFLWVSLA